MRRSTLASAGFLVLLSGSALAADAGVDLPMTAPGFDWTGYYAGLQGGYGWGRSDISTTEGAPFSITPDIDGGFVGGRPPAVAPGDYRVVLVVDGQEFAQSLRVEADPTVPNSDVIAGEEEIDQSDEDEAESGDQ